VPGAPAAAVSLAVNLGDSVLVAEPAINNDYSQQVIAAIHAHWPGKPISHIIATQWHFDTTGGIRQYAAIGANLIVPGEKRFFREILSRPHTIDPDLLSRTQTRPRLTPVDADGIALSDGAVTVHRFSSAREAEMLLVCTRDSKLAYTGDLFNPSLPADAPAPEPFRTWARDMYTAIQANCPWVQNVLGSHGLPQPEPIATLLTHAGLGE
jgi:glyoxylase-like metal-dependent hydrolase (beta-lactamase superfamily II)